MTFLLKDLKVDVIGAFSNNENFLDKKKNLKPVFKIK